MPFDFFPYFTAFLIFLLSTYLESSYPSDEFHLIRNKTVGKQRHGVIKKIAQPNISYCFTVCCNLVLGVLQNTA